VFIVSVTLVVLAFVFDRANPSDSQNALFFAEHAFTVLAGLFIILVFLWYIVKTEFYTMDHILGGITIYLLLALVFARAFIMVQNIWSGSFMATSGPAGLVSDSDLLYLSFCTITTLGYGDIVPVSSHARRMCSIEATIGVLYIAIFIGRLVGMGIRTQRGSKRNPGRNNAVSTRNPEEAE
jgi:hypothetical protein